MKAIVVLNVLTAGVGLAQTARGSGWSWQNPLLPGESFSSYRNAGCQYRTERLITNVQDPKSGPASITMLQETIQNETGTLPQISP